MSEGSSSFHRSAEWLAIIEDTYRHPKPISSVGILPISQLVDIDHLSVLTPSDVVYMEGKLLLPNENVNGWGLPGHGSALDHCGSYFMLGCLNVDEHPDHQGVFQVAKDRCYRPVCPDCFTSWIGRESERISERISAFWKKGMGKPIHVVVSPPNSVWHLPLEKLHDLSYRISERAGFFGGSCIYHAFRFPWDEDDINFVSQELNYGINKIHFSPHFHMIGYGWIDRSVEEFRKTGWIVKNLGVRHSVFGTAFYQLTHCAVWYGHGKKHSVTWFGELSYNKLKIKRTSSPSSFCKYCGERLHKLSWVGNGSEPLPFHACGEQYLDDPGGWDESRYLFYANPDPFHMKSYLGV